MLPAVLVLCIDIIMDIPSRQFLYNFPGKFIIVNRSDL